MGGVSMLKPTPADRIEFARVVVRLGVIEATRRCKAFDSAEPYAWFWTDGSDGGVITVRQDYEHHKAKYPRMTFSPVFAAPLPADAGQRENPK